MKTIFLLFISLFINSVFGDKDERVSVTDGGSVTLHTNLTDLKGDDVIVWRFNNSRIARINRAVSENPVYESDERFTDRLKMNPQTGDLTITNITSELTGYYHLEIIIINSDKTITKTFSINLSPQVQTVMYRDSVSLHIDVTDEQRNDKIHWKIKHKNSLVAEIITQNGTITENKTYNKFRDRLKLNDQTGDLNITNMKNEDSGYYEADVTINNTHTIHNTFCFTDSSSSSGMIAGICVGVLLVIVGVVVGVVIYCRPIMKRLDFTTGVEMETNVPLRNVDNSKVDVPPD